MSDTAAAIQALPHDDTSSDPAQAPDPHAHDSFARPAIAILVRRFPKLSETFILKEILDLEARRWPLHIFTLSPPSDAVAHADVAKVRATVEQLPEDAPEQALAERLIALGIHHLHAHFADSPAAVARRAAAIAGIGYSISAHAKDIYCTDQKLLRENLHSAYFAVTCSAHNATALRRIAPGVPVAKLYHGIDCDRLVPAVHSSCRKDTHCDAPVGDGTAGSDDRPLILSVGRLRAKKGFDTLISACTLLRAKEVRFRCAIVGYGPEQSRLEALISNAGLQDSIHLLGKLPHTHVLSLFRQARVFALACRIDENGDRDGIPNVVLEAMAMGVPVVSTAVSGVPEAVHDGVNGWLVPPEDAVALAARIESLLSDASLCRRTAKAARETVLERFTGAPDIDTLDRLLRAAAGATHSGVAYVLKGFPRLSESFISNEVLELESAGSLLTLFALKSGDCLAEPVLRDLRAPLAYLPDVTSISGTTVVRWLRENFAAHANAHGRLVRKRPLAYFKTMMRTLYFALRYRGNARGPIRRGFIKEFVQAGMIADQLLLRRIRHVHGHFCHSATTVTWMAADLANARFSFTAHAKDLYQPGLNPADLLERKISAADFVATCTQANHSVLVDRSPADAANVHTIYHGLDSNFFSPNANEKSDPPLLLAVGRHVRKKGFDLLITACATLKARGHRFECLIVGEPGDATRDLQAAIATSGLADVVTLSPARSRIELRDMYRRASIFALPCRIDDNGDRDGIPNVLSEAMATELPVISTNISGIPEVVIDGRNGLLIPPNDADALASTIECLLLDPNRREYLGKAARETICNHFDARETTRALQILLERAA